MGFMVSRDICDNPEYFSEYLRFIAMSDQRKGIATTHMLINDGDILGYITLRASSYTKDVCGTVLGEPAIEIFELAVADGNERTGTGSALVKYAILKAMDLRESIGVRYVLLLATKSAVPFYEKIGFEKVGAIGEVPRDQMNQECIPMYLLLPEDQN